MKELVISNKFIAKFKDKKNGEFYSFEFAIELETDIIEQAWQQYEFLTELKRFDNHLLQSIVPDVNLFAEINKQKKETPTINGESLAAMITALTNCYSSLDDGSLQHVELKRLARTRLVNLLKQDITIE